MTAAAKWAAAAAIAAASSASAAAEPSVGAVADVSAVLASLAAVVGVILAAAYAARRLPFGFAGLAGRGNGQLKVVAQLPLGPRERLLLVEARGSELLIAVSPAGVFNVASADAHGLGRREPAPEFRLEEPR